jgi:hypothetical protein
MLQMTLMLSFWQVLQLGDGETEEQALDFSDGIAKNGKVQPPVALTSHICDRGQLLLHKSFLSHYWLTAAASQ